ncbi:MAG TPA: glycosyltransferase family 39 protein [Microlunatus sp.]|nr:glycosyltransferase family 39 protein [Microlunatus sp.]
MTTLAVVISLLCRLIERRAVRPDYDDGVYWQTAMAIGAGKQPYTEVFDAQPPLFSWLIALAFRPELSLAVHAETIARLLMILFAMLLCLSAAGVASSLGGSRAGMIAALVTATLPIVQSYSYQFGADLPAAALTAAALWCAVRAGSSTSPRLIWAATGAIVTLALFVKLIAVVVLPAIAILIAATALQVPSTRARVLRALKISVWAFTGASATALLMILLLRPPRRAWQQVFQFHLQAAGDVHQDIERAALGAGVWYWLFLLLAVSATVYNLRHSPKDRATMVAVIVFAATGPLFVLLHRPIFGHHMLLFVMPGSVLIAVAANDLLSRTNGLLPTLTILIASLFCAMQWVFLDVAPPFRQTTVEACLRTLPSDYEIVTDDQELLARAGLKTPPSLVDTSYVRIKSGYLSSRDIAAAIDHAEGVLLSPRGRLRTTGAPKWSERHFSVRYTADGYDLYVGTGATLAGCRGKVRILAKPVR